ncbi:hypothetical protein DOZ80_17180 [Pseudomonas fluorescens]|uniref:Uncharacterized protein n=1 Tax=Pseudomonas fluorescens TaxID=294 RepID=A0A327MYZ7_PSEFL|nr:hypothetical protein DOZ80_17180 [Pseudomonas fluorescens]
MICFAETTRHKPVGASLLAMDVNDNAGCLNPRGVSAFFASKLAPTGFWRCSNRRFITTLSSSCWSAVRIASLT